MGFLNLRTPNSFAVTILWSEHGNQGQGHLKVNVIPESNCVSISISKWAVDLLKVNVIPESNCVSISISKWAVDLRPNAFLLPNAFGKFPLEIVIKD